MQHACFINLASMFVHFSIRLPYLTPLAQCNIRPVHTRDIYADFRYDFFVKFENVQNICDIAVTLICKIALKPPAVNSPISSTLFRWSAMHFCFRETYPFHSELQIFVNFLLFLKKYISGDKRCLESTSPHVHMYVASKNIHI